MPTRAGRRLIGPRDLLRFHMVEDPQLSPDARRAAWVERWMDPAHDCYRSAIVVTDLHSGISQRVTSGQTLDTWPRWSPDGGALAYLSSPSPPTAGPAAASVMGGAPQLWIRRDDGPPRQLTWLRGGVQSPAWAPDGSRLAFTTYIDLDRGLETLTAPDREGDDEAYRRGNRDVLITHRLHWKADGVGYIGDHYRLPAVLSLGGPEGAPAPITLLAHGPFDLTGPVWSPDGQVLAAIGNLRPDGEGVRRQYVYLIEAGLVPSIPREVAGLEEMRSTALTWTPDGEGVIVTGHDDPVLGHYGNQRVWWIDVCDGRKRCLTAALDRTVGDYSRNADLRDVAGSGDGPRWLPDGSGLLILVNEEGTVHLHRLSMPDGRLTALTAGDCVVTAFSMDTAGRTVLVHVSDALTPGDLFTLDLAVPAPAPLRRLTALNEGLLAEVDLSRPERFRVRSDAADVDAWLVPPAGREPGRRYPLLLYTGGGPGGMRASVFVHEFHVLAAAGYAVLHCNARGNQGYGEAFSAAIRGRWGELDYADNMAVVRAALERFDYLDPSRLAVAGGSYGGYLVNWIIARHPEFRAAISDRCLFNRFSQHGTSDIGYLLDLVEFEGREPWDDPATYLERSPMRDIHAARTPTLVLHSGLDHRCAVEQGEQLYMALRRIGVPARLVRFPTETHDLSRSGRPWHRVLRLEQYLAWFERWV